MKKSHGEDLEGSTDGSVPPAVDVVDDETAHTESEDMAMGMWSSRAGKHGKHGGCWWSLNG